ncbi:MAG: UDP-2,4-diacetamido-2,4,6-trideoxy-beta-L-altropyranose hydrolase [Puniceicoccaceae bacterium]
MTDSAQKKVIIRADAGGELGSGHVMRMLALAQALQKRGVSVLMASIQCPDQLLCHLRSSGIAHHPMEEVTLGGVEDSAQVLSLAREQQASWLVLDGYHFGHGYQRCLHEAGFKVAVMDDFAHTEEWCADLIINQNLGTEGNTYRNDIPAYRYLGGHCFAMLRKEFTEAAISHPQKRGPIHHLLLTMGGVDAGDASGKILEALEKVTGTNLKITVVAGGGNPHLESLRQRAADSRHSVKVACNVENMTKLYNEVDGVISGGGSTCYEWLYYGLPAAVVELAENQAPIVRELERTGAALNLGIPEDLAEAATIQSLQAWLESPSPTGEACPRVDGKGADRVAAALDNKLRITIATAEKSWMNGYIEQSVKEGAFKEHEVTVVHDAAKAPPGDMLFLLSYWSIADAATLGKHTHNLVVHASDLPKGKGWSPVSWQILEGCDRITFCLFEAVDKVDAGPIYLRKVMELQGDELLDEIRAQQAAISLELCARFSAEYPYSCATGEPQQGEESFYPKRSPEDSRLDPHKPIAEQFNLLRIADNEAYPAFFEYEGKTYILRVSKKASPSENRETPNEH